VAKKKILVPMDGSDSALNALKWAAKEPDAALFILNVQPALPSSRLVTKAMIAEHQQRNANTALAPARALVKRRKIEARIFVAIGDPAPEIVAFANKNRCAVIVMGSRGRGQLAGLILGSIATNVIYLAKCPVTIVK
jgi:nucleotide-binding universal stress UspA family protein